MYCIPPYILSNNLEELKSYVNIKAMKVETLSLFIIWRRVWEWNNGMH